MNSRKDDSETESRRILDRIAKESAAGGQSFLARRADRARDHLSGADIDPDDRIELWGTRIGRGLGLIVTIVLVLWLIVFVFGGG